MHARETVKPITFLKANAAELVRDAAETGNLTVITQNGEARAVLMGIDQYHEWQQSLAMLKIAAMGEADIAEGNLVPADEVFDDAESILARATKNA